MNLTNLAYMDLIENNLQGEVPNSLFKLENLEILYLTNNLLEGELELDKFLMLKMLNLVGLSSNKLSIISVAYNSLIGKISPLICNLKSLVQLDLSFNNLTGIVPSCLGSSIQSLQTVLLNGNKLTGPIPQTYMTTSDLRMIDLSNNNLQGQLPRALVNCPIPQTKQFATFDGSSFEGNQGLCGNQLLKKCEDHGGSPFSPPSASNDDQDSGFIGEFEWKVALIGYGSGLIAGVALGRAFGQEVLLWLKRLV
uniref:Phytosulfokine receptor 1 n=1 Tax=Cajanus cajan TaxID=3821 RepID=A0A151TQC7_CAJCA|nr:Phytosulfokine receptor 1 [Cajanus cajan]